MIPKIVGILIYLCVDIVPCGLSIFSFKVLYDQIEINFVQYFLLR